MSEPRLVPYTTNYTNRTTTIATLAVIAAGIVLVVAGSVNAGEHFVTQNNELPVSLIGVPSPIAVFGTCSTGSTITLSGGYRRLARRFRRFAGSGLVR